jgi:hypothetical protein
MAKEKIVSPVPRPPAYVMDALITSLFEAGGEQKKIAIKITSYVLEYQAKCSSAETELMQKVQKELKLII